MSTASSQQMNYTGVVCYETDVYISEKSVWLKHWRSLQQQQVGL